jgi:hypothetical protein
MLVAILSAFFVFGGEGSTLLGLVALKSWPNTGGMMRNVRLAVSVLLSGLFMLMVQNVPAQETSTPEERMQWVEVTHKLESSPLDDSVNKQGEAAFKRLSDVHDVHVLLCPALLSEFNGMKYVYAHTITRQYMLASGAFQIENPDKTADAKATALAAVESVLKTYQAILKQKPDAKAKPLDDLLKKQNQGKLQDSLKKCP